tara:strand:+ start:465 stop:689 length:225 start_codon:yes stop_codon:yes gene_type:complete
MSTKNELNLQGKSAKDQLLAVEEILKSITKSDSVEILTNEELLVKYIPPKAIEKKIKIKFKYKDDIWRITLEKE